MTYYDLEIIHFNLHINFKTYISKNIIRCYICFTGKTESNTFGVFVLFCFFSGSESTAGEIEMMSIQVLKAKYWLLSKAEKNC